MRIARAVFVFRDCCAEPRGTPPPPMAGPDRSPAPPRIPPATGGSTDWPFPGCGRWRSGRHRRQRTAPAAGRKSKVTIAGREATLQRKHRTRPARRKRSTSENPRPSINWRQNFSHTIARMENIHSPNPLPFDSLPRPRSGRAALGCFLRGQGAFQRAQLQFTGNARFDD